MNQRFSSKCISVAPTRRGSRLFVACAAVLASSALTQAATAQVTFLDYFKVRVFEQTANNTLPATEFTWATDSFFTATANNDYSSATINGVFSYGLDVALAEWDFFQIYADKASLDADFPQGSSVLVNLVGNTQPSVSQSIPIGSDNYPPTPPFLTGTSYNDLLNIDINAPLTLTFPSPASIGSVQGFVDILQDPDGVDLDVFDIQLSAGDTSVVIPAGTLAAGIVYRFEIGYTNRTSFPANPAGLNAPYEVSYESITIVDFTTASAFSCTSDLNGDGIVDGADLGMLLGAWGACP